MFIAYRPVHDISKIVQWFKGISSGNITDEMIQQYIQEQEGEPIVDDSRFQIDPN
jgi:REP element-mobilizing transposase RayT